MNTPPATQQTSRSSTGALSQQSTLVPTRPPSEALRKALIQFRNRLLPHEFATFQNTTYKSLCDDLVQIQREQEKRKEMMDLFRVQACLESMLHLQKTIEVFLNASQFVAFVWGPMKFLLLTASTIKDAFDTLLDAYEQIGKQLPFLSDYESLYSENPYMIDALESMYIDILAFHQRAIRFFRGSKMRHMFRAMWRVYDTEFQGILQSLNRHKGFVEHRAAILHYQKYQTDMAELKMKLDEQVAEEKLKKLIMIREWLAVGPHLNQNHLEFQHIRQSYSTTARWILKHEFVTHWIEADVPATPLLWMHGIPGAGKTILASAIIDECKKKTGFKTSCFYCHDGDLSSNSAIGIIKGLADQLLQQEVDDLLQPFYSGRTSSGDASLRSLPLAKKLLDECCDIVPKLFFGR